MKQSSLSWHYLICISLACLSLISSRLVQAEDDSSELFVRRIAPLLREKCVACHGQDESAIEGGLDLRSRAGLLKGGDSSEPSLVPDHPENSPLYLAMLRTDDNWSAMPPKEAERITEQQLGWVKQWIQSGAAWPTTKEQAEIARKNEKLWSAEDGITMQTSGGLSAEWTNRKYQPESLWAYQPIAKPDVDSNANPVDQLIEAQLPDGLQVAPRADRLTLIRRATFDLTGLPPTPAEIEEFLAHPGNDQQAFSELVDRLLASPHYGEKMAQHWLDVVRYADSSGLANDYERGNAWRYRDYVIRSFNADKPYDQFVKEQLAGDEIDASNPEMIVATGFLRMGPWELTGMEVAKVARQRFLDDVTNSVGETFLAHSLQCARCHDHKFDPVPTRDYYSIQAVFATTQLADRKAAFLREENQSGFAEKKYLDQQKNEYNRILRELDQVLVKNSPRWFEENDVSPDTWNKVLQELKKSGKTSGVFNAARSKMRQRKIPEDQYPPKLYGFTPDQFGLERVARKGLGRLRWVYDRYQPYALAVYNGVTPNVKSIYAPIRMPKDRMKNGQLEKTAILTGGDPFGSAEPVQPGVLSAAARDQQFDITDQVDGRRLAFAKWVVDPANPLTPRVIVNRLWGWHFNQPIAGNPNNFGSTGKMPTHPELLDWLAATLIESDWSIKQMHRLMMNTDAYCRDTKHPEPYVLSEQDPLGTSYAVFRPRRLTAEELRDAMLSATGELNQQLGGIPCRPEINQEAALQPRQVMGSFASAWVPNTSPEQRHRRSIYVLRLRGLAVPSFEVFNSPAPDFSCEFREASTVTPQVFSLFNGKSTHQRALKLAEKITQQVSDRPEAIRQIFQLILNRAPEKSELQACLQHWEQVESILPKQAVAQQKLPLQVTRNAIEENTGERFRFQENLYANVDFVPDLRVEQLSRKTRALADVCLVLFNSNEFVYVY